MSWSEAWDLTEELMRDPSSHVAAALADWEYPWSQESGILADLVDVIRMANTSKRGRSKLEPYPRPFPVERPTVTRSRKPQVSQDQIKTLMARLGHHRT